MISEEFRNNTLPIGNTLMNKDEINLHTKNDIENFAQFHYNMIKGRLDTFDPQTVQSKKWKNWVTMLDLRYVKIVKICTVKFMKSMKRYTMSHRYIQIADAKYAIWMQ